MALVYFFNRPNSWMYIYQSHPVEFLFSELLLVVLELVVVIKGGKNCKKWSVINRCPWSQLNKTVWIIMMTRAQWIDFVQRYVDGRNFMIIWVKKKESACRWNQLVPVLACMLFVVHQIRCGVPSWVFVVIITVWVIIIAHLLKWSCHFTQYLEKVEG